MELCRLCRRVRASISPRVPRNRSLTAFDCEQQRRAPRFGAQDAHLLAERERDLARTRRTSPLLEGGDEGHQLRAAVVVEIDREAVLVDPAQLHASARAPSAIPRVGSVVAEQDRSPLQLPPLLCLLVVLLHHSVRVCRAAIFVIDPT
jgi:hypothetical protein